MSNKVYNYEGREITFQLTGKDGVMINATQMVKAFEGKRINNYLRMEETQELVRALIRRKSPSIGETLFSASLSISELANLDNSVLKVVKGGLGEQGTWMCEDLALDFAQWLSVDFKLWCNDRIKELLTIGFTATPETLEKMILNPDLVIGLAAKLKEAREEIKVLQPKADFYDAVAQSEDTIDVGQVAKVLAIKGYGRNNLFKFLREQNVLMHNNQPYQKYIDNGCFKQIETQWYDRKAEMTHIGLKTVVYQKGLDFIRNLINSQNK